MIVAALAAAGAAGAALAAPEAAPQGGPAQPANSGVTSYPPSFFATFRPNTALDMVNDLPGFSLDTGGGVRGFGGAAGNVLIDGDRPATKSDSLDAILQRIPAGSVERIDVIRGGAPGMDMRGKTVIANVIRKLDTRLHLTTALQGTLDYNGHVDYGLRVEGARQVGKLALEGSLLLGTGADDGAGNGPHRIFAPNGQLQEEDTIRYFGDGGQDKATAAVEAPLLGGKLRLEGSYQHSPYFSRNDDLSPDPANLQSEIFTQRQDTGEVGLRYSRRIGAKLGLELYALQQLSRFGEVDDLADPGDVSTFVLGKHQGESIGRGEVTFDALPNLTLEGALEGDFNFVVSHTVETDNGAPEVVPAANVRVSERRGEAFVDATWQPWRTLTVEGGLRVEASNLVSTGDVLSSQTFIFPKPRAVVTWAPNGANQLQLRVEREVTQLDFNYFTASGTLVGGERAGNPTLTPQQDWVIEASYDRHFWKGGDIGLIARRYWLQDAIDYAGVCAPADLLPGTGLCDPAAEFPGPSNIGDGSREELSASLTLPTDRLMLKNGQLILRATWRHSQVIDPATHQPREISGLHPVDSEIHFTQGLPKLKSTWTIDVIPAWRQSEYLFSEVDTQRLGVWIDAYFEYKPRPDLSIKIEGDNLATHGLEQIRAFYDPFRDVNGGVLNSIDNRSPRFGPELTIRVRKTFG
ncbi:MAG TPA: TonB-dependent receptor plug domain-containing protein [Caulobacteraceae bacterium]